MPEKAIGDLADPLAEITNRDQRDIDVCGLVAARRIPCDGTGARLPRLLQVIEAM